MDNEAAARVLDLFDGRGELDRLDHVETADADACAIDAVRHALSTQ